MKKELEIYIHIPFCVQKCKYCDFLSGPATSEIKQQYMEALCREIMEKGAEYEGYHITSVFIGGGTPSCVEPEWIEKLMRLLRENYDLSEETEITMEMNPGTVDRASLEIYYHAGINRLSMGLQSARSEELAVLGRIHSYEQFLEAYFTARKIGFLNINVDIISGLPGQTLEDYMETLSKVTELDPPPEHISAYSLIVEEGTPFYEAYERDELNLPDEETDRSMYESTRTFLQQKGYERYEISNYAKKGFECRHNIGYWERKHYVGFGIGAASLVENVRFRNGDSLDWYIQNPCESVTDVEGLSVEEQMAEMMFLGLRMEKGVSFQRFQEVFGVSLIKVYGKVIEKHVQEGLLQIKEDQVFLTLKGMDVSNYVMADFLEP